MERCDDNRVMDENPYRSPETVGAGHPGEIALWFSRIVWFGLGGLGASATAMGLLILGMSILQSTRAAGVEVLIGFGFGLVVVWMGGFLVWRATKRFRRHDQAQIAIR
ncbi:MAG: hypothetical protein SGJ19_08770 [Planctomycetia bacterium]|nr:hypothetical protein [Planctomycetia bacterium]